MGPACFCRLPRRESSSFVERGSISLDSPNAMSKQSVTENSANNEGAENSKIVLRKPRIGGIYKQYKRVIREYVLVSISYLFGTKSLNACLQCIFQLLVFTNNLYCSH